MLILHGELLSFERVDYVTRAGVPGSKVVGRILTRDGQANIYEVTFDKAVQVEHLQPHAAKQGYFSLRAIAKSTPTGRTWIEFYGCKPVNVKG